VRAGSKERQNLSGNWRQQKCFKKSPSGADPTRVRGKPVKSKKIRGKGGEIAAKNEIQFEEKRRHWIEKAGKI